MKGNNIFHKSLGRKAITPIVLAATEAATGVTISEPWDKGRQIMFTLVAGAITGTATCIVQGLRRDDGTTWEALKEGPFQAGGTPLGTTDLQFTPAKLANDAELEANGYLVGTLDLGQLQATTYKAIRLVYTCGTTSTAAIAASYMIYDLKREPSGVTDDLFFKQTLGAA